MMDSVLYILSTNGRRHTSCALVTGAQTWALPILGSLDRLRDVEPDDPPVRLGEDHAPFGERHARRPLATAFDRLRIGDGYLGLLEKPIASRPGGIVPIHRDGWVDRKSVV